MKKFALFALLLSLAVLASSEPPNPFTSSGSPSPEASSAPTTGLIAALVPILRSLTDRLTELVRQMRGTKSLLPLLTLALISLIYGVFHSLGPGHGKTIVSTFFLAKDARIGHSLIAGYLIAAVHAVSAIGIVLALFYLVQGIFSIGFENASRMVQIASFGAIAVIGGLMLIRRILGKEHSHHFGRGHSHEHECDHEHEHADAGGPGEPSAVTVRELLGIAFASGVVPCPGASAILLVSLSMSVAIAGIISVIMISVGMGVTVTVVGAIAILAKRGVLKASAAKPGGASRIARRVLEIGGAALLFLLGLAFFVSQF
jgi:ABC-type nickel/cobalt efflux system permease component RcnA